VSYDQRKNSFIQLGLLFLFFLTVGAMLHWVRMLETVAIVTYHLQEELTRTAASMLMIALNW